MNKEQLRKELVEAVPILGYTGFKDVEALVEFIMSKLTNHKQDENKQQILSEIFGIEDHTRV